MRNKGIDILRGLGILSIIFIHVTAWYTFDKTAYFIWNWGQFAVPIFVFCSTYLFFVKKGQYEQEGFIKYSLKRLKRLLLPYYWFLVFFFLIYIVKDFTKIHWQTILMQLTLTTPGTEPNWIVLLFVYLALLMFPLVELWRRARPFFVLYAVLALGSSLFLLSYTWPFNYKLIMWLPWSLIILFSWYFARYENRRFFYPFTTFATGLIFLTLYFSRNFFGNSFLLIGNKYPPDLYYLSYGMLAITLIYYLTKKGIFDFLQKPISFLSFHSYPIFFIHLLLVIAFSEFMNIRLLPWWGFFTITFTLAVVIQIGFGKIKSCGAR
jgi:peptidoglycan/LPS O-acetylase OafA/YrhL